MLKILLNPGLNLTIFLGPGIDSNERVLQATHAKRVARKPVRETHAPIERLGSSRNQYGDELLTRHNTCVVNWILKNMIRLLELGFDLQQFFYLLVNTWLSS